MELLKTDYLLYLEILLFGMEVSLYENSTFGADLD